MEIGLQLKIARVEKEDEGKGRWNMRKLSKESGVSTSHICEIESGKKNPTAATINKLCKALGYDLRIVKKEI